MKINRLINHSSTIPVLAGLAGLVNGSIIGYILGKRNGEALAFETLSEMTVPALLEINQMDIELPFNLPEIISFDRPKQTTKEYVNQFINNINNVDTASDDIFIDEQEIINANADKMPLEVKIPENVFKNLDVEWNYEDELKNRGERDPYVIHLDEYHGHESGLRQSALTYYAGDDILTDEDDAPLSNYQDTTGPLLFGHGSHSEDMVFIRNPRLDAEYEVCRSYDSYVSAILGFEADAAVEANEIRHSRYPERRNWDE